ncbi:hypothetical protein ANCCAN_07979 [Ancylostoma caninum]|uniref:Reverse transcriptase domain-containing protein n=1 Tax=Ancylostoma caninum TaxID=29170 RepID=A0A368GNU4_ANCCA|nr:hypothetical protein ANCCAN_07979 [Ancylostoma caninum]
MEAVLNLGPSFAIATAVNQKLLDSVMCGFYKIAYQAQWRENSHPTVLDRISSFTASILFPRTSVLTPKPSPSLEPALATLQLNIIQAYSRLTRTEHASNLTERERRGLKKLLELRNELRYSVSDKSGDFVVLTQTMDKDLVNRDFSDATTYEKSSTTAFDKVSSELRSTIKRILGKIMNAKTVKRFILTFPIVPTYYTSVKIHKIPADVDLKDITEKEIRTRPIISSCGGPSDRISWFLVKLLSPLLHNVAAHVTNVEEFISALNRSDLPENVCYASFDAVSLYTNIDNDEAIDAVLDLLQRHHNEVHTFGLTGDDLRELLVATLSCNIFQFDGNFYRQKRGLAMGLRISPLLAVVYMDRIERKSLNSGILFYKRYIDDVFVIGSADSDLNTLLETLNTCDPNISFTSVNMEHDWKLLNIFIGGNDMCGYCRHPSYAPNICVQHIKESIQIIYDNVPRVIVSLTTMLHLEVLRQTDKGHTFCVKLHKNECGCENNTTFTDADIAKACIDYANGELALGSSGIFDKDDFTLAVQPFFRDIVDPPMKVLEIINRCREDLTHPL